MKKYWLAVLFLFSLTVNYATFVSNDKVNERIFQRELALPEYFFFFQRLDKLEQFGKRPQASRMIVSHANNHLLTLSEFASDKANYHLKMSSKTLWAKSLHHDSQLYYNRYVTTRTHTHKCGQTCINTLLWTSCRDGRFVLLLHLTRIGFKPIRCPFCFIFQLVMFKDISAALYTVRNVGRCRSKRGKFSNTRWKHQQA